MIEIKTARRGPHGDTPYWDIFRDGKFIIGAQSEAEAEDRKTMLEANEWTHLDCYKRGHPDPLGWIAHIREMGWTFLDSRIDTSTDGRAFFHGNIVQYSAAFRYMILDQGLLKNVMSAAPEVPVKHWE